MFSAEAVSDENVLTFTVFLVKDVSHENELCDLLKTVQFCTDSLVWG